MPTGYGLVGIAAGTPGSTVIYRGTERRVSWPKSVGSVPLCSGGLTSSGAKHCPKTVEIVA